MNDDTTSVVYGPDSRGQALTYERLLELLAMRAAVDALGLDELWRVLKQKRGSRR